MNGIDSLPLEIIHDILSRLPVKSLLRCKCVCRAWHDAIEDPQLVEIHLTRSTQNHHFAGITILNVQVSGYCNGLLCLRDKDDLHYLCVYNPITRESLLLPKDTSLDLESCSYVGVGLGFDAASRVYKVVRLIQGKGRNTRSLEARILTLGTESWRGIGCFPLRIHSSEESSLYPTAFVDGSLHWLAKSTTLFFMISIEVGSEKVNVNRCSKLGSMHLWEKAILSEWKGRISLWAPRSCHAHMWVLKDDGKGKKSWRKEFTVRFKDQIVTCSKPLDMLKNGEILVRNKSGGKHLHLASYHIQSQRFSTVAGVEGIPEGNVNSIMVFTESLVSIKAAIAVAAGKT